jgi:hypothetical protein
MRFIRFVQARRHPESGVDDGLFGLAYELRDSPQIAAEDRAMLADALKSSTVSTKRSSSSARSTSTPTTANAEKRREELTLVRIARATPGSSMNATWKASWPSQNAFSRAPPTSACRRRSTSASG